MSTLLAPRDVEIRHFHERWLPVADFPGYEVSDEGRVRSTLGNGGDGPGRWRPGAPRILKPWPDNHGYLKVTFRRGGRSFARKVSRLVLEAFVGPPPRPTDDACHRNGDRLDNRLQNLRWDTRAANLADRIGHGTDQRGERCATAKLTAADVHTIRARLAAGESQAAIAGDYRLAPATVGKIGRRERWGHL